MTELGVSLLGMLLFSIFFTMYIKKSIQKKIGFLLLFPTLLWMVDLINTIKYNDHPYNTIITEIGFSVSVFSIGLTIYQLKKI